MTKIVNSKSTSIFNEERLDWSDNPVKVWKINFFFKRLNHVSGVVKETYQDRSLTLNLPRPICAWPSDGRSWFCHSKPSWDPTNINNFVFISYYTRNTINNKLSALHAPSESGQNFPSSAATVGPLWVLFISHFILFNFECFFFFLVGDKKTKRRKTIRYVRFRLWL